MAFGEGRVRSIDAEVRRGRPDIRKTEVEINDEGDEIGLQQQQVVVSNWGLLCAS
jgi:hypothetical protein